MSKRTNSIVAVTIVKYATVYVEADTPKDAAEIVKNHIDDIYDKMMSDIDGQFADSDIEVDSWDVYTTEAEEYMDHIWADGEAKKLDDYIDELDEES